jgi:mono/diheme cytochrome c family protein
LLNGQDTPDYEIQMPAHNFLTDEEVAAVASYIRRHFGRIRDTVTKEDVTKVRNLQLRKD